MTPGDELRDRVNEAMARRMEREKAVKTNSSPEQADAQRKVALSLFKSFLCNLLSWASKDDK